MLRHVTLYAAAASADADAAAIHADIAVFAMLHYRRVADGYVSIIYADFAMPLRFHTHIIYDVTRYFDFR